MTKNGKCNELVWLLLPLGRSPCVNQDGVLPASHVIEYVRFSSKLDAFLHLKGLKESAKKNCAPGLMKNEQDSAQFIFISLVHVSYDTSSILYDFHSLITVPFFQVLHKQVRIFVRSILAVRTHVISKRTEKT